MATKTERINSLDVIRGVVMVLMAIDHVRVYSGVPAGGPTANIFFTRWVTNFCAPAFVFLAGTGAYLYGKKLGDVAALRRYLITRGAVLVLLELTVIRASWTFNFDYAHYVLAGVIWMLGWCMILLAGLVHFRTKSIAIAGGAIVMFQQLLFPLVKAAPGPFGWIMQLAYGGGAIPIGSHGSQLIILYVIVPWIGVMALGYAFGAIMTRDDAARRTLCLRIGVAATGLFLVVGTIKTIADGPAQDGTPWLFRLLAQQKYPASQLFLLMTLGPTIALIPFAERARGWLANVMATFGRVPMFYYLLHIPTIHAAALVVSYVRTGAATPWLFTNHPMRPGEMPAGYMWGLPLLYLVFAIVVTLLYFPCRWFARAKAERRATWLRYI